MLELNENPADVMQLINRAVKLNPKNSSRLDSLGWADFKQGKLVEAEQLATEAIKLGETENAEQHEHLVDIYRLRGKTKAARAARQKALALSADEPQKARINKKLL